MNSVSSLLKFSVLPILLIGAEVSLFIHPVRSNSNPIQLADARTCRKAISAAHNKLNQVKNVRVSFFYNSQHGYDRYPINRTMSYDFALAGSGVGNVLSSPVFMRDISTQIISNCASIGIVSFGRAHTDTGETYGLMPKNGRVEAFKCLTPSANEIPWGYTICL